MTNVTKIGRCVSSIGSVCAIEVLVESSYRGVGCFTVHLQWAKKVASTKCWPKSCIEKQSRYYWII